MFVIRKCRKCKIDVVGCEAIAKAVCIGWLTSVITIVSSFFVTGLNCTILTNRRLILLKNSRRRTVERYCSSRSSICRPVHATQKPDWKLPNKKKTPWIMIIIWQMPRNERVSSKYLLAFSVLVSCGCVLVCASFHPCSTRMQKRKLAWLSNRVQSDVLYVWRLALSAFDTFGRKRARMCVVVRFAVWWRHLAAG